MIDSDLDTFYPKNKSEWRQWLSENHISKSSVWVIFHKKASQLPTISWSDSVDEALCFGWIDSTKKSINETTFIQYFSKRKPNSIWSKINKDKVAQLTQEGLMSKAGLACIQIAQENGSWSLYDEVEQLIVPTDLEVAFTIQPLAKEFYTNLSKSKQKMLLYWIVAAKREETRTKRVNEIAKLAAENLLPKQFR